MSRVADFTKATKDSLAAKVGYHCSNPFCRISTIGASEDGTRTINIGEAAHIAAASPGGARYNPMLSDDERKAERNGIWLCRTHAAMIDRDPTFFTEDLLLRWKTDAEKEANERLQGIAPSVDLIYTLRILYDDLKRASDYIQWLIDINRAVVFNPEEFHVTDDYENRIGLIKDFIGLATASGMRNCFIEIEKFKPIVSDERKRSKGQTRLDMQAARYDTNLKDFIERMKNLKIQKIVEEVGRLFEVTDAT